jgi:hypothetical protein
MAKVVSPLMSIEARGKVGGLIFNTWRGLNTVKSFKSPVQPNTALQLAAKARLQTESQAWASLTAAQRTAWNQYAQDHILTDWTGKTKRLSGQNWFIACNCRLLLAGQAAITAPPAVPAPAAVVGFALSYDGAVTHKIQATWTSPIAAGVKLFIYAVGPLGAGRTPKIERAHIVQTPLSNVSTPLTIIDNSVAGKYGGWAVAVDIATGLASEPVFSEVTGL